MMHNDISTYQQPSASPAQTGGVRESQQQTLHIARGQAQPSFQGHPAFDSRITQSIFNLIQQLLSLLNKPATAEAKPKPLNLSQAQNNDLKRLAGFSESAPISVHVLDENGDGEVSEGDTLVLTGGVHNEEMSRLTLSERDISILNQQLPLPDEFVANREKWDQLSRDPNVVVEYTMQQSCFCPQDYTRPMDVTEQNGRIMGAIYADNGERVPDYVLDGLLSIDERFEQLQDAYENEAQQVDVTYDPEYGFPEEVFINQSDQLADEEVYYEISDMLLMTAQK